MPIERSLPHYYQSFSKELEVTKDRVRNIIGKAHWISDGTHKEAILQEVLRRFIPQKYVVSSGFILSNDGETCSKQLDIIIYDQASPLVFNSSNFVIIPSQYVRAVIEVKTSLSVGAKLTDALENLSTVQKIMDQTSDYVYFGIFSFGYQNFRSIGPVTVAQRLFTRISEFYRNKRLQDTHLTDLQYLQRRTLTSLCMNGQLYGLHWNGSTQIEPEFGLYDTGEQSFNFFVSNLLSTLDNSTISQSKPLWFPESKQSRVLLKKSISV
ncbi:DUF6602 domain-containing protein [Cohnella faecalis]|uniref:DUF6602 domain-containing protein n=1 Tax=Cohnella faecalis TaxID=2315694 RepID=A0A398CUH4_9BACL|nr:DUF6602 domain-containing protein [Cohnella faecalis]RIE02931.1 hypothetical protein D3H35_20190 [Cohnella faecalis]